MNDIANIPVLIRLAVILLMFGATTARAQIVVVNSILPGQGSSGSIGEYNLDGTSVNASLVTGLVGAIGIASSGNEIFVTNDNSGGYIGKYSMSGATVNASLISGLVQPRALAISGGNLFVASTPSGPMGTVRVYTTSGTLLYTASYVSAHRV